jgi:low affinity Fe/Cu permease
MTDKQNKPDGGALTRLPDVFHKFAHKTSVVVGSPWASVIAMLTIAVWAVSGPIFGFSDTWQLVINTSTTIVTFLMVFLIQNTQNRDAEVMQLKLDELIRAIKGARNSLIDLEEMSEEELKKLEEEFRKLRAEKPTPSSRGQP